MYNTIGQGSENIGDFSETWYWSSSLNNENSVWNVNFGDDGNTTTDNLVGQDLFRPIRAFGNWTMGCMDSLACNYNTEANMSDGSCSYPEDGYDCDGNELQFSMSFDGYIEMPNFIINDQPEFTISARVKTIDSLSSGILYRQISGGEINFNMGEGLVHFSVKASNGNCWTSSGWIGVSAPIPDNEWHLYSSVYNRLTGFIKLYIDDVLVADTLVNNGSLANCNTYSSMVGSTTPSNIILDELAIFDYAYTEYDIQQITCSFQSSVLDHIFAYWNFNEGQGNPLMI